jgi:hypothetical protein
VVGFVPHGCGILDASEDVPDVSERPQRDVSHLEATFVVDVGVAVDLVDLVVHQSLGNQAVHLDHMGRGEFVRIEFSGATEQD